MLARRAGGARSSDDLRDQRPGDIGETHVAAVELVGELRVVHPQQVQYGRVQVMRRDRLLLGLVAERVARADNLTALYPRARHQGCHRTGVVIAADTSLRDRHPPELSVPNDERRVEQAARAEIRQKAGDGKVRLRRVLTMILHEIAVGIPRVGVLIVTSP